MRRGSLFQIRGAERRKARDPNDRLCRGINSWWEEDERKDLVEWWCCKRSVRYGGRPAMPWRLRWRVWTVCATQVEASGAVLRSSLEENGVRERWFTTTLASARCTRWRRPVCFRAVPYKTEFIWSRDSRRDETSRRNRSGRGIIQGWTDLSKRADVVKIGLR